MENDLKDQKEVNSILDKEVKGVKIRDMSPAAFCTYCLSFLNNTPAYDPEVQALTRKLNGWFQETMADGTKLDIIVKLKSLGYYK
jgi:hypothetical protein